MIHIILGAIILLILGLAAFLHWTMIGGGKIMSWFLSYLVGVGNSRDGFRWVMIIFFSIIILAWMLGKFSH